MSTLDMILMFALTATGAISIGHGLFQVFSKGTEYRTRALGEITVGIGFCMIGWDLLSGLSMVTAFGIMVGMLGTAVATGRTRDAT